MRALSILLLCGVAVAEDVAQLTERLIRDISDENHGFAPTDAELESLAASPGHAADVCAAALTHVRQATAATLKWKHINKKIHDLIERCVAKSAGNVDVVHATAVVAEFDLQRVLVHGNQPSPALWERAVERRLAVHKQGPTIESRLAATRLMIDANLFDDRLAALCTQGRELQPHLFLWRVPEMRNRIDAVRTAIAEGPRHKARKLFKLLHQNWKRLPELKRREPDMLRLFNDVVTLSLANRLNVRLKYHTESVTTGLWDKVTLSFPAGGRWHWVKREPSIAMIGRPSQGLDTVRHLVGRVFRSIGPTASVDLLEYGWGSQFDDGEGNPTFANNLKLFARGFLAGLTQTVNGARVVWKPHVRPVNGHIRRDCYKIELTGLNDTGEFVRHRIHFFKGKRFTFCLYIRESTVEESPEIKAIIDSVRID